MHLRTASCVLFVLVLFASFPAQAINGVVNGTFPVGSDGKDIEQWIEYYWHTGGLLCAWHGAFVVWPISDPDVRFELKAFVPGGTTTATYPFTLDVTYDENIRRFTKVELTINATTHDITQALKVYSFPESKVSTIQFKKSAVPTLGEWGAIGTGIGLLVLGAGFIARRRVAA